MKFQTPAKSKVTKRKALDYQFLLPKSYKNDEDITPYKLLLGFQENTTSHGLPRIFLSPGFCKKVMWTVICLLAASGLTYLTVKVIIDYLSRRVNVDIRIVTQQKLQFPTITVCNMSPIKKSVLAKDRTASQLLDKATFSPNKNSSLDAQFDQEEAVFSLLAQLDEKHKVNLGFSRDEFVVFCSYAGYLCTASDITFHYNTLHGNCYMFNSGWHNTSSIKLSVRSGRRYGLKLYLDIQQDEYIDKVGGSAGARIVIHAPNRMPFPEDEGVLVQPGTMSAIALRKVIAERLPLPFHKDSPCTGQQDKNVTRNVYEELYPAVGYSTQACVKTCYQRLLIQNCGCGDPFYPLHGSAFSSHGNDSTSARVPICEKANVVQETCKRAVEQKYTDGQYQCDCPVACNEDIFTSDVSVAQWPSFIHEKEILSELNQKTLDRLKGKSFRENLLGVEIFYEEFNYEKLNEVEAYGIQQFFSDIGGTLGLLLGFSLVTVCEILEFLLDLCILLVGFRGRKKTNRVYQSPTPVPQSGPTPVMQSEKTQLFKPPEYTHM